MKTNLPKWLYGRRPFMGGKFTAYFLHDPDENGKITTYMQDVRTGEDALFDNLADAQKAVREFMNAGGMLCTS
jgi:hypothetical protein